MNGLSQILADISNNINGGFPYVLDFKDINSRIRVLIDAEMGYIASLHDSKEVIAREEAFQDLISRLKELSQNFIEKATQEQLRLAELINPAPLLVRNQEKIFYPPITRAYFDTPPQVDEGVSLLAIRLLLLPKQIHFGWQNSMINEFEHPEHVAQIQNNCVLAFPKISKELSKKNQIIALGILLGNAKATVEYAEVNGTKQFINYLPDVVVHKLQKQFDRCISGFDRNNPYAIADAFTACYLINTNTYMHCTWFISLKRFSDLKLLEQLDFSLISNQHLEVLDRVCVRPYFADEGKELGGEDHNTAYFSIYTWTKKRIKEASNIPPDLTLMLRHGESIQVHAALLAQNSEGLLGYLRDPNYTCAGLPSIDLSLFNPADVSYLLRKVYGIVCPYSPSNTFNNLLGYLYGKNFEESNLGKIISPQGPDALTDVNIFCKDHVVLQAHRIILSRGLGIPVGKDLDWSKIDSDDARMLLDFIYSNELDGQTIQRVIEAVQILDIPEALERIRDLFERGVEEVKAILRNINESDYMRLYYRPEAILKANRLRYIYNSAPEFFFKLFDPLERDLQVKIKSWICDIGKCHIKEDGESVWYLAPTLRNLRLAELVCDKLQIERWTKASQYLLTHGKYNEIDMRIIPEALSFRGKTFTFEQLSYLCCNLIDNPTIKVDLSETNIIDYTLNKLVQGSYPILTLKLDGCKGLSISVQKLLRGEIPTQEELKEDTNDELNGNGDLIKYLMNTVVKC